MLNHFPTFQKGASQKIETWGTNSYLRWMVFHLGSNLQDRKPMACWKITVCMDHFARNLHGDGYFPWYCPNCHVENYRRGGSLNDTKRDHIDIYWPTWGWGTPVWSVITQLYQRFWCEKLHYVQSRPKGFWSIAISANAWGVFARFWGASASWGAIRFQGWKLGSCWCHSGE